MLVDVINHLNLVKARKGERKTKRKRLQIARQHHLTDHQAHVLLESGMLLRSGIPFQCAFLIASTKSGQIQKEAYEHCAAKKNICLRFQIVMRRFLKSL